jgi:hypothetical protein
MIAEPLFRRKLDKSFGQPEEASDTQSAGAGNPFDETAKSIP